MNNEHQNNEPIREVDPWERDTYQTGSTTPRKSYGGTIAFFLALCIGLCGMLSILAALKIPVFETADPGNDPAPLSIQANNKQNEPTTDPTIPTAPTRIEQDQDEDNTDAIHMGDSPIGADNIPQAGGMSLQDIYEQCIPSVVSINCNYYGGTSTGTGVILSHEGYIVTNAHVVEDGITVQVILNDGEILDAVIVGADKISDIAVLWVDRHGLIPAELGDSNVLRVGDAVVAIGDPLGISLRGTMTSGIISGINRDITVDSRTMTLIQTTAALNEGNSGGPLINCYGQVIGINTMKIGDSMSSAGVEGLGFAIPSATVSEIANQLIGQGYVSGRPDLGMKGEAVSMMKQLYGRLPSGLYLTEVHEHSDAYAKGIRPDDVLMAVNGVRINNEEEYETQLFACQVGEVVTVVIFRDGWQYEIQLTVGEAGA